jgi:hypothetical protein
MELGCVVRVSDGDDLVLGDGRCGVGRDLVVGSVLGSACGGPRVTSRAENLFEFFLRVKERLAAANKKGCSFLLNVRTFGVLILSAKIEKSELL